MLLGAERHWTRPKALKPQTLCHYTTGWAFPSSRGARCTQHNLTAYIHKYATDFSRRATIVHGAFHKHSTPHATASSSRPELCNRYLLSLFSSTDTRTRKDTHTHARTLEARPRFACEKILRWTMAIASPGLFWCALSSVFKLPVHRMPWRRCRCLHCKELRSQFMRRIPEYIVSVYKACDTENDATVLVQKTCTKFATIAPRKKTILFQVTGAADDLDGCLEAR